MPFYLIRFRKNKRPIAPAFVFKKFKDSGGSPAEFSCSIYYERRIRLWFSDLSQHSCCVFPFQALFVGVGTIGR
jgi:hypothetical protein